MKPCLLVPALLATALVSAGCDYRGAESIPLPGGVSKSDSYEVILLVPDASNLVPRETCRANDTVVGSVESVELTADRRARIVCRIKNSVRLPANVRATLKETSLLGERFVALDPPNGIEPEGVLEPGATLKEDSGTDPNVETVLSALSQVLNGGSLGSLGTITRELGAALRDADLASTIRLLGSTTGTLAANQPAIDQALDGLDALFAKLADQRQVIDSALASIPAGIAALDRQRPALVKTLNELRRLSAAARPLIRDSQEATVAGLKALVPTLRGLDEANDELALTLERIGTFPFPSNSLSAIKNGYTGFNGTILLDLDTVSSLLSTALSSGGGPALPAPSRSNGDTPVSESRTSLLEGLLGGLTGSQQGADPAAVTSPLEQLLGSLLGGGAK